MLLHLLPITEAAQRLLLLWTLSLTSFMLAAYNERAKWKDRNRWERLFAWSLIGFGCVGSLRGAYWTFDSAQREAAENNARFIRNETSIDAVARKNGAHLLRDDRQQMRIGVAFRKYAGLRIQVNSTTDSAEFCRNLIDAFRKFGTFPDSHIENRCNTPPGGAYLDVTPAPIPHQILVTASLIDGNDAASTLIGVLQKENLDAGGPTETPSPEQQSEYGEKAIGPVSVVISIFSP